MHTSNYRIVGFAEEVPAARMAEIAHAHGLPIETLPPYHAQPPLFPLPLEELASMSIPPEGL